MKRYLAALGRYKWMILIVVVLGTGLGFAVARLQKPVYEARAQLWIGSGLTGGSQTQPIRSGQLLQASGWEALMKSSAVLDSVVRRNRLYLSYSDPGDSIAFKEFGLKERFQPGTYTLALDEGRRGYVLTDQDGVVRETGTVGDSVGGELGFRWIPPAAVLAARRRLEFTLRPPGDVTFEFAQQLVVNLPEESNFMRVRLRGEDRDRITVTLNAVVDRFYDVATRLKKARLTEQKAILEEQLRFAQNKLSEAESELRDFQIETATLPSDRGTPVVPGLQMTDASAFGNYFQLTGERDQLLRDREAIVSALQDRPDASSLVTSLEVISAVKGSSELSQALDAATQTQANIRALLVTYTPEWQPIKQQQAHLDSLQYRVIPQLARQLVTELNRREGEIDETIAAAGSELKKIPARQIEEGQLQRRASIADALYRDLENRYQAAQLAEATAMPDMDIVDHATVPFTPVEDPRQQFFLMFLAGSIGLGVAGALLRDRLDPRLRYPDQVTAGMGLHILGAVPALRRGKLGSTDMALAVEAFRAIQLSLVHAHGAQVPLTVTFTSPGASDGKSFVTSNLAIAFADMGHRTLVIDGDVRRGTLHQLLGTAHKPGLTDYLAGNVARTEIVQATRYPLLDMIGCGSRGEAGPKLLGSPTMAELMDALREDYDVILVDSPPLGACVDPMILSTLTRNMVLVLRTGTTDRAMAESKLDILDRLPVRVLGAVLNDVSASGPYRYYSYITGYEVIDEVDGGKEVKKLQDAGA